jgi:hypothetical protein
MWSRTGSGDEACDRHPTARTTSHARLIAASDPKRLTSAFAAAHPISPSSTSRTVSNENEEKMVKEPHAPVPTSRTSVSPAPPNVTSPRTKLPMTLTASVPTG